MDFPNKYKGLRNFNPRSLHLVQCTHHREGSRGPVPGTPRVEKERPRYRALLVIVVIILVMSLDEVKLQPDRRHPKGALVVRYRHGMGIAQIESGL